MPRNQNAGNAGNLALRNRIRVTNKTRLKVVKGNIEADPIILDEDEERARVVSTAGVDAEDANEHHLQAVLSAASHRATTLAQRATRGPSTEKTEKPKESTAFIPVPDAAGVVEEYSTLYPSDKWIDPASYVKFSSTVDECIEMSLVDGFTYYMDERDVEWLEKNNQDARGEGTSSQAVRTNGAQRSARSKGKEVDTATSVSMSEIEFELVMGVFEKVTHDNTPFLHIQGTIPPFSDYQDIFSNPLPVSIFATYIRPANLPDPPTLLRMARNVYPYWKDRRTERECHRIIPNLNFDESDVKNESYICFRRREIKAVRKTRAAQTSSSDKLIRLKSEISSAFELARMICGREVTKRLCTAESRVLWDRRQTLADFKRQFPGLVGRDDDDHLLFDKERISRAPRRVDQSASQLLRLKKGMSGEQSSSPTPVEPQMKPRERFHVITNNIEDQLKRQKEIDHHWDDQLDNPYQQPPVHSSDRRFKRVQVEQDQSTSGPVRSSFPLRLRVGRGGFTRIDRRPTVRLRYGGRDVLNYNSRKGDDATEPVDDEDIRRKIEQWKYDADNSNPDVGTDEEDRVLVDDFDTKYIGQSTRFLQDSDITHITTDPRLFLHDGQAVNVIMPFRVSPHISPRKESIMHARPSVPVPPFHLSGNAPTVASANPRQNSSQVTATPVAVQTPVKKMPPPAGHPVQVRNPQHVPQRSPSVVSQSSVAGTASSPPAANAQFAVPLSNANSSVSPASSSVTLQPNGVTTNIPNGVVIPISNGRASPANGTSSLDVVQSTNRANSPVRPKSSQNQIQLNLQQLGMANGLASNGITNFAGYNTIPGSYAALTQQQLAQQHVLNMHQATQLKRAFAMNQNVPLQQQLSNNVNGAARPSQASYAQLAGNVNINNLSAMMGAGNMSLKLPASRQMQWNSQRATSAGNANEAALLNQNIQIGAMMNGAANGMNGIAGMNGMNNLAAMNAMAVAQMNGMNGVAHAQNGAQAVHMSPPNRHAQTQSPANGAVGHHNVHSSPVHAHQLLAQHGANGMGGSPSQVHLTPPRNMQTPIPGPQPSPLMQHQHIVGGINQGQNY